MDNQFTNYLTDERYVTSYGFNQKGIVYIENEMDYRFGRRSLTNSTLINTISKHPSSMTEREEKML